MNRLLLAAALMCGGSEVARAAERGAAFNGMFIDALKIARTNWLANACLGSFWYDYSPATPTSENQKSHEWHRFNFYSSSAPNKSYSVAYKDDKPPEYRIDAVSNPPRCISEMPVTFAKAYQRALKAGLSENAKLPLHASLDRFDIEQLELGRALPNSVVTPLAPQGAGTMMPGRTPSNVPLGREAWLLKNDDPGSDAILFSVALDARTGRVLKTVDGRKTR